jgi:hypothetical protein
VENVTERIVGMNSDVMATVESTIEDEREEGELVERLAFFGQ